MKPRKPGQGVSDEAFVMAWNRASTLGQACYLLGYNTPRGPGVATNRAKRLRARGIPLKRFSRVDDALVTKLQRIAASALADYVEGL